MVAVTGAVLAGLGVAFGAFGAHALEQSLDADELRTYETAVRYQLLHAVALVAIGLAGPRSRMCVVACLSILGGTILFSGSLYALVFSGASWIGIVTPVGGFAMILGWALFAGSIPRARQGAAINRRSSRRPRT